MPSVLPFSSMPCIGRQPPSRTSMHGGDMAGGGEHQAHGVLGHRRVAVALDGRDLDAELRGGREIDEARRPGAQEHDVLQAGAALQRASLK